MDSEDVETVSETAFIDNRATAAPTLVNGSEQAPNGLGDLSFSAVSSEMPVSDILIL